MVDWQQDGCHWQCTPDGRRVSGPADELTVSCYDRVAVLNQLRVTTARRIATGRKISTCGRGRDCFLDDSRPPVGAFTVGTQIASARCTVVCWIGVEHEGNQWLIRLAGRLSVDHVPDLLKVCGDHGSEPVEVELSDLLSADAAGIDALRRVRHAGAHLTGTPTYIQLKLDTPA